MQGCNPIARRTSNPAGPSGGDITRAGQPAGTSGKRKIPSGSGGRVPPGSMSSLRSNNKPCRANSVGLSKLPAFHAEPKHSRDPFTPVLVAGSVRNPKQPLQAKSDCNKYPRPSTSSC